MKQTCLFPDPQPLVERLGLAFFRHAPEGPGVYPTAEPGWAGLCPGGGCSSQAAERLRGCLTRLLWCALRPQSGLAGLPAGWFRGRHGGTLSIPRADSEPSGLWEAEGRLLALVAGQTGAFAEWIRERTAAQQNPFDRASRDADLEAVCEWFSPVG